MSDYTIRGPDRVVHGWKTDQDAVPSGGYGGFQVTPRPKKAALTVWQGRDPFTLTIPMLLHRHGNSIEDEIHDLGVLSSGTSRGAPPQVNVQGAILVPTHAGRDWTIEDLQWGAARRRRNGTITRQEVTVVLQEFVDDTSLPTSTEDTLRNGRTIIRHYRVKHGDTLLSIAARELGDAKRWTDIAVLNGLRSSGQLKPGRLIRLP